MGFVFSPFLIRSLNAQFNSTSKIIFCYVTYVFIYPVYSINSITWTKISTKCVLSMTVCFRSDSFPSKQVDFYVMFNNHNDTNNRYRDNDFVYVAFTAILMGPSIKGLRHLIFRFDIFNALNHLVILKHESRPYRTLSSNWMCNRTSYRAHWKLNVKLIAQWVGTIQFNTYHISKFAIQFPWWKESDFTFRKINSIFLCLCLLRSVSVALPLQMHRHYKSIRSLVGDAECSPLVCFGTG